MPLEVGSSATFLASTTTSFDSQGVTQNGQLVWDFDVDLDGDELISYETVDPKSQWFGASYPDATYAKRDDALLSFTSEDVWVVFQATGDALLMLGLASLAEGSTRTELTFDPPVTMFDFPLAEGKVWSTSTTVTGLLQGISVSYTETHEHEVDARGIARTPYGELEVLRVRSDLTRTIIPLTTTRRTFDFVAECFGTAARIVSQQDEAAEEFDEPSRVLRLSP